MLNTLYALNIGRVVQSAVLNLFIGILVLQPQSCPHS